MRRVKRRIFSGSVCEQEVYTVAANKQNTKTAEPRPRFQNEAERIAHRVGIARRHHNRVFNATFTRESLYSTLTMDDAHEVHTYKEACEMADLFARRLKYANPNAQFIIYLGRGRNTHRIHLHMVSNGLDEATIKAKWNAGTVLRIEHLRDYKDYTALAEYLFSHWEAWEPNDNRGTHYYKATKNLQKPEVEKPTEAKRVYSESRPPRAPKGYRLVEYKCSQFGYQNFKYIKEGEDYPRRARR